MEHLKDEDHTVRHIRPGIHASSIPQLPPQSTPQQYSLDNPPLRSIDDPLVPSIDDPQLPPVAYETISALISSSNSTNEAQAGIHDRSLEIPHENNDQLPIASATAFRLPDEPDEVAIDNGTIIDGVVVTEEQISRRSSYTTASVAVIFFVIPSLLVGATLAIILFSIGKEAQSTHQPSLAPTLSSSPTTLFDYEVFLKNIAIQVSGEIVNDESSVQYLVTKYIAGNMPLLLEKGLVDLNDTDDIAQRYILSVLYVSTFTKESRSQFKSDLIHNHRISHCELVFCTCNDDSEIIALDVQNMISVTGGGGILASEIGALPELRQILCTRNGLVSTIPSEIGNLKHLRTLDLRGNAFTGSIPTTIGNLKSLELLDVSNNMLDGSIPSEIGGLDSLKYLDLSQNGLVGDIPLELHTLMSIKTLKLRNNSLTGNLEYFCNRSSSMVGEGDETIIEGENDIVSYVFEPAFELDCNDDGE